MTWKNTNEREERTSKKAKKGLYW